MSSLIRWIRTDRGSLWYMVIGFAAVLAFTATNRCGSDPGNTGTSADGVTADQSGTELPMSGDAAELAILPDAAECQPGQRVCVGAMEVAECQGNQYITVAVCPTTHFCWAGTCIQSEPCQPGTTAECHSLTELKVCNDEGTAYVPQACPEGMKCADGACGNLVCNPGQTQCVGDTHIATCLADGSAWSDAEACEDGTSCIGGKCLSACMSDPKFANSYMGCEYWTLDLDQSDKATLGSLHTPPAVAPHSVVLSNPGTLPAKVTFTTIAEGITLPFGEETIGPGEIREFTMPRMDLSGAGVFDRSVRIRSNRPLVATQFNPKDVANTYSNDSSLLLPVEVLGTEYVVLGWPSQTELPISIYPALLGYFTIAAVEPGETKVTVTLSSESFGLVDGAAPLAPGIPHTFTLQQFHVLQLQGVSKTLQMENDMSGSLIKADRKVAVFTGHQGPLICPEQAKANCPVDDPFDDRSDCCCLEHLEEQLWPLDTWVNEILAPKAKKRGSLDFDTWRVQAGVDNVAISTDPVIAGLDGTTIAKKGQFIQVATDRSFKISATGPIQMAQYLSSMTCTTSQTGDPAQIMAVGIDQYRDNYPFLVPQGYTEDWVTIVRPVGSTTTLDGAPVDVDFTEIGSSGFEVGYKKVTAGPHNMEGTAPFGLIQYGFFEATSYGNPVGLNLLRAQ